MFQNIALNIYKTIFKHGSEELLLQIFVKANLLGQLQIAYKDISQSNMCIKMFHGDDFIYSLKQLLTEINYLYKVLLPRSCFLSVLVEQNTARAGHNLPLKASELERTKERSFVILFLLEKSHMTTGLLRI